jgi:hypothetical protein
VPNPCFFDVLQEGEKGEEGEAGKNIIPVVPNTFLVDPLAHLPTWCSNIKFSDGKKKKSKRGGGPKPIKKKDPGAGGMVTITRMSRNKRKSVTVVTGLDTYSGRRHEAQQVSARVLHL